MKPWQSKGERLVVGVSGGKDSGATCLHLEEEYGLGPDDYDRVFCDTGWELPEVYDYVRGPLSERVGQIHEVSLSVPKLSEESEVVARHLEGLLGFHSPMVRLVLHKGSFPGRLRRFCTQKLKAETVSRFLDGLECEPVNVVGIRAEESRARSKMPEWEWSGQHDCWVWRPLIRWTWDDVVKIHKRHGLKPAPPYMEGAERVGCAPCIFARKSELAWLAEKHPERIKVLDLLERAVWWLAAERAHSKGRTLKNRPTWFQNPKAPRGPDGKVLTNAPGYRATWPIGDVIGWARGPRNQIELFEGRTEDHGCMRWGFCDTGKGKSDAQR